MFIGLYTRLLDIAWYCCNSQPDPKIYGNEIYCLYVFIVFGLPFCVGKPYGMMLAYRGHSKL